MDEKHILITLRQMAWKRAKGEMMSILDTFWFEEEEYQKLKKMLDDFIEEMDDASPLA